MGITIEENSASERFVQRICSYIKHQLIRFFSSTRGIIVLKLDISDYLQVKRAFLVASTPIRPYILEVIGDTFMANYFISYVNSKQHNGKLSLIICYQRFYVVHGEKKALCE